MRSPLVALLLLSTSGRSKAFASTTNRRSKNQLGVRSPSHQLPFPERRLPNFGQRRSPPLSARDQSSPEGENNEINKESKLVGLLVLLSVPLSWGTYVPVVRYLYAIQPPVPGFVFSACYYALAATTMSLLAWSQKKHTMSKDVDQDRLGRKGLPIQGGIELGSYLFIANCLQVIGLRTVESDRAGFLVQLTTVLVPFVEALFGGNLTTVPIRTWLACLFSFIGLFIMGLDGKVVSEPVSAFVTALSSFTQGDFLIIGAAVLYTLHVVRLGTYAKQTTPLQLAASKAIVETILSVALCLGLVAISSIFGSSTGLLGFAASTGREISTFFSAFRDGISSGSLSRSTLVPAFGTVLWTGWVTCAYTIYAQSFGQSRVSPTSANLIYTFQPIFTALFGWLLLGESMGPAGFVGGAVIAASVYMVASAGFDDSEKELPNADMDQESIELILTPEAAKQTEDELVGAANTTSTR